MGSMLQPPPAAPDKGVLLGGRQPMPPPLPPLPANHTLIEKATTARAIGPAWTQGEIEKPAGEKDMGSWKALAYTEEQQARLGVNEAGEKVEVEAEPAAPAIASGASTGRLGASLSADMLPTGPLNSEPLSNGINRVNRVNEVNEVVYKADLLAIISVSPVGGPGPRATRLSGISDTWAKRCRVAILTLNASADAAEPSINTDTVELWQMPLHEHTARVSQVGQFLTNRADP